MNESIDTTNDVTAATSAAPEAATQPAVEPEPELEPAVEPEPEPELEPAVEPATTSEPEPEPLRRQWIALSAGSCDLRVGAQALLQFGHICKSQVGIPHTMTLLYDDAVDTDTLDELRRQTTSAGFELVEAHLEHMNYTLSSVDAICRILLEHHITADDMICATGSACTLQLCEYAARTWCSGVRFMALPIDISGLICATTQPEALSCSNSTAMISIPSQADHVLFDTAYVPRDLACSQARFMRVMMVASAMAESQSQFGTLWDNAYTIMHDDPEELIDYAIEGIKLRGRMLASSALSIRQAAAYGEIISRALIRASHNAIDPALAYAEALRFSARLAVSLEALSVDDCLAQDELLSRFEIPWASVDINPAELQQELHNECFLRSHKCMLPLPQTIGRVRMTNVTPELLAEHTRAWCDAHATQN